MYLFIYLFVCSSVYLGISYLLNAVICIQPLPAILQLHLHFSILSWWAMIFHDLQLKPPVNPAVKPYPCQYTRQAQGILTPMKVIQFSFNFCAWFMLQSNVSRSPGKMGFIPHSVHFITRSSFLFYGSCQRVRLPTTSTLYTSNSLRGLFPFFLLLLPVFQGLLSSSCCFWSKSSFASGMKHQCSWCLHTRGAPVTTMHTVTLAPTLSSPLPNPLPEFTLTGKSP